MRRGEVQRHARMVVQERLHELRLVGGQVVEDHLDLLVGCADRHHFPEEAQEVTLVCRAVGLR